MGLGHYLQTHERVEEDIQLGLQVLSVLPGIGEVFRVASFLMNAPIMYSEIEEHQYGSLAVTVAGTLLDTTALGTKYVPQIKNYLTGAVKEGSSLARSSSIVSKDRGRYTEGTVEEEEEESVDQEITKTSHGGGGTPSKTWSNLPYRMGKHVWDELGEYKQLLFRGPKASSSEYGGFWSQVGRGAGTRAGFFSKGFFGVDFNTFMKSDEDWNVQNNWRFLQPSYSDLNKQLFSYGFGKLSQYSLRFTGEYELRNKTNIF